MTSAGGDATIAPIRPSEGDWAEFLMLYRDTFAEWERESERRISAHTAAGRYRVHALSICGHGIGGFHVVDVLHEPPYAVLTFVAVAPRWRGRGLGLRLVRDAVLRHREIPDAPTLLVEAKAAAARLYARGGFRPLALDYRIPHYDEPGTETPMWLLADVSDPDTDSLDGSWLGAVVRQMFGDGYGLGDDDPRLTSQLARIPERVPLASASKLISSG